MSTDLAESAFAEQDARQTEARAALDLSSPQPSGAALLSRPEALELGLWLDALRSFFNPRNHPFTDAELAELPRRDFASETRIARQAMLSGARLAQSLISPAPATSFAAMGEGDGLDLTATNGFRSSAAADEASRDLVALAEALTDMAVICDGLLAAGAVKFNTWVSAGKVLARELERTRGARLCALASRHAAAARLPPALLYLTHELKPDALSADAREIFSGLTRLLERLRFIAARLRSDLPLKQTLPVFALLRAEARALINFIEIRALRTEDLNGFVFDAFDSAAYAISMEMRKVFAHELVGLSALRQAPAIYAKVENAHGLLRDCFQQSTVALAQIFDPALDGARLFDTFQTKLEQSLALRRDLWTVLQLVKRAERERDRQPVSVLLERLNAFRAGSLRYLMFKDWEAYERFVEEAAAARGAVELTPVLHRFGTYLETLFGQISMRAVLADYPFDFPAIED